MAAALSSCTSKPRDFLARFGGEEFVLPETDAAGALRIAEKCQEALAAASIEHETSPQGRVTLSLGVGTIVPGEFDDQLEFIATLDHCMYEAEKGGRNALVVRQ